MAELKGKVQQRLKTVRRNSEEVLSRMATQYENYSKEQVLVSLPVSRLYIFHEDRISE